MLGERAEGADGVFKRTYYKMKRATAKQKKSIEAIKKITRSLRKEPSLKIRLQKNLFHINPNYQVLRLSNYSGELPKNFGKLLLPEECVHEQHVFAHYVLFDEPYYKYQKCMGCLEIIGCIKLSAQEWKKLTARFKQFRLEHVGRA